MSNDVTSRKLCFQTLSEIKKRKKNCHLCSKFAPRCLIPELPLYYLSLTLTDK